MYATTCKAYTKKRRVCEITPLKNKLTYCHGASCIYGYDILRINKWLELRLSQDIKDRWQARELYFDMVTDAVMKGDFIPFPPVPPSPLAKVPDDYFKSEKRILDQFFEDDPVFFNRTHLLYTLAFLDQFQRLGKKFIDIWKE
jgi:hypothetical protein